MRLPVLDLQHMLWSVFVNSVSFIWERGTYFFKRLAHDKSYSGDLLGLAHSVYPSESLLFYVRIPMRLHEICPTCRSQINSVVFFSMQYTCGTSGTSLQRCAYPTAPH